MKHRLLCMLLACVLAFSLLPAAALAAGEDLTAYVPVLDDAMKNDAVPDTFGEAMFYDLDDQAPRELILVRCPEDAAHAVVEVWTIRSGKAEKLMGEPLYVLAGGNFGSALVGEYESRPILVTISTSPEAGETTATITGAVKRYGMENGELKLKESAAYTEVRDITDKAPADPVIYDKSSSVIEGEWHTYADYLDWRHSFVLLSANDGFTDEALFNDDAEPFASARDYCATGFRDVKSKDYFADAVVWAVQKGVTDGAAVDLFKPAGTCTRAQFVTFLWRAAGKPASRGVTPFTDVAGGRYYTDAVAWAVSQGITNGTSDTTFSPNATLTRAQVVTFLWRYAGSPKAGAAASFTDVKSGSWYAAAVAWAVEKGVTDGTGKTTFSPSRACTRGETVTFLYRQLGK